MPAHIINEGIVSGGMFIAIGESIIARVAALGGYICFSLTLVRKPPMNRYVPGTVVSVFPRASESQAKLLYVSHRLIVKKSIVLYGPNHVRN